MNKKTEDIYYKAYRSRDPKFDGKFFTGVNTTGIYCRPICPARSPKRENVTFFESTLQAEKAGFRPCLRCRPESAPDSPLWFGSSSVIKRAIRALSDEQLSALKEEEFAALFGLTARHLRRLFKQKTGHTPGQIKQIQRLNFARKLIVETDLAFIDIAFNSGFSSVRRFNEAVKQRFTKTPSALRKRKLKKEADSIQFSISYRPPIDWEDCLVYYQKHKIGELETFQDKSFTRIFVRDGCVNEITVRHNETCSKLEVTLKPANASHINYAMSRVKSMFDLSMDPVFVTDAFLRSKDYKTKVSAWHGARLISCWDPFELAISAILGQLISIKQATVLTQQLIDLCGESVLNPLTNKMLNLFPSPEILSQHSLAGLKVPEMKKQAIRSLSDLVCKRELQFSTHQNSQDFKQKLLAIKGIGPWTSEYIALRAIGDVDAYPECDVYLQKKVANTHIDDLSPWRGYLVSALYKGGDN